MENLDLYIRFMGDLYYNLFIGSKIWIPVIIFSILGGIICFFLMLHNNKKLRGMKKLNNCPFCGNDVIGILRDIHEGPPEELIGCKYMYAECMDCDARTGDCFEDDAPLLGYESAEQMMLIKWNRREKGK